VAELLERLGSSGALLAREVVERLGDLCSAAGDAGDDEDTTPAECARAAEAAMGVALRALGPEAVLDILPLNLEQARVSPGGGGVAPAEPRVGRRHPRATGNAVCSSCTQ
jgi:NUC173 domain